LLAVSHQRVGQLRRGAITPAPGAGRARGTSRGSGARRPTGR
jgi:hypothetical protein